MAKPFKFKARVCGAGIANSNGAELMNTTLILFWTKFFHIPEFLALWEI
jgi:hypothetical protein